MMLRSDATCEMVRNAEAMPSLRSRIGLNATNFFLAEVLGVIMPFLAKFLAERDWRDDAIGMAIAVSGLGLCLMQTPAGFLVDRVKQRRWLLVGSSLVVGVCFGILPLVPTTAWIVDSLLFLGGVGQAFFTPLLGALALGLVGHAALNGTIGVNQGWNHAGNIAAAVSAMLLVGWLGLPSIFYTVIVISILAAGSVLVIREDEIDESRATGADVGERPEQFRKLLSDPRVLVLFAATALFHLANAPVMPLVGLYIGRL
ncbi:MAG TPA: MFS transporter, partial [Gemmataceae bacterium]|nr:MFS transporter [Gemmataceae bacterium]